MEEQEKKYDYYFECISCFLNWHVNSDIELEEETLCNPCKKFDHMTSKQLLMRKI